MGFYKGIRGRPATLVANESTGYFLFMFRFFSIFFLFFCVVGEEEGTNCELFVFLCNFSPLLKLLLFKLLYLALVAFIF